MDRGYSNLLKGSDLFEVVGKDFSFTRERISQIEAKALRKLRNPSRSKKLLSFFEKDSISLPIDDDFDYTNDKE